MLFKTVCPVWVISEKLFLIFWVSNFNIAWIIEIKVGSIVSAVIFVFILALNLSLFSRNYQKTVKLGINEVVMMVWLIYAVCYKDYLVMSICVVILLYNKLCF